MNLKPIETVYKGYRFRSRLEARWAVFFSHLGVKWEYEPEGFELGKAGRYLPDFWLPTEKLWIEIKATRPTEAEINKAQALFDVSGHVVAILYGTPLGGFEIAVNDTTDSSGGFCWWSSEDHFCQNEGLIFYRGKLGFSLLTRSDRTFFDGDWDECAVHNQYDMDEGWAPRSRAAINTAVVAARSARFEFGEVPA